MCIRDSTHTHTHTSARVLAYIHIHPRTLWHTSCKPTVVLGEGQYCTVGVCRKEKCFELVFEARESGRMPYVLGEVVPDVRTEVGEREKTKSLEFAF